MRRIRSVENYLHALPHGTELQITLTDVEAHRRRLIQAGFSADLNVGERVLPSVLGPKSRFNANGFDKPLRDQPKETVYREGIVTDWHGRTHYVDIPYERYPREHIPAPSEELTIALHEDQKIVTSQTYVYQPDQLERIKHTMNLFFELFGECTVKSDVLVQLRNIEIERRNWRILPPGEYPWEVSRQILREGMGRMSDNNRRLVEGRYQVLSEFGPNTLILGQAGMDGYAVFAFENLGLYVLESRFTNNATYIFGRNWEQLSQLTKAEILNGDLHLHRLYHIGNWVERITNLLGRHRAA